LGDYLAKQSAITASRYEYNRIIAAKKEWHRRRDLEVGDRTCIPAEIEDAV
jgi:hypothetical protein